MPRARTPSSLPFARTTVQNQREELTAATSGRRRPTGELDECMATTRPKTPSYIIKRPRLTKLLDESEARIILLCAPAGYGKTTLAREWVESQGSPVAWYSGGSEMSDAAALAVGLASALEVASGHNRLLSSMRMSAAQTQDSTTLARLLSRDVSEAEASILVIDDYHNVADSAASEELIAAFARLSSIRIVITSRTRPHWLNSRLTIYGEALVVGREELAFTSQEAMAVLPKSDGDEEMHLLEQAKGWPAVIGLAAIRGRRGASPAYSLLPDELYEYFAEDLFKSTPVPLRRSLLLLALGTTHHMTVARDLIDDENGALIKEATTLGFVAIANDRVEIHPLLRGFLRRRLREAEDDQLVSHALSCFATHREWAECLETLTNFPESSLCSVILDQALPELLASGRAATVRRWSRLARDAGHNEPTLLIAEAELALRERDEATAQMLSERAGEIVGDADAAARAYVVAARAAHLQGDALAAKRNSRRAQALTNVTETLVAAQWLEFVNAAERQDPDVKSVVRRLRATADGSPDHLLRVVNAEIFLNLEVEGNIREAIRQAAAGEKPFGDVSDPLIRTTYLNLASSALIYLACYDQALNFANRLTEDARSSGVEFAADHALLSEAGARIGRRQLGLAERVLHELETRGGVVSTFVQGKKQLRSAQLRVAAGDLDGAERVLRERPPDELSPGFHGEWLGTRAVILAGLGDKPRADAEIARARATSKYADAICLAELAAAILELRAETNTAGVLARSSLAGVLGRGFLDLVVFACRVSPALAAASGGDAGLESELTVLLRTSRDFDIGRVAGLDVSRHYRRGDELSPRERDVCELLSRGRSNREIATALFISESTAKVHVRHIYEKLGVRNRAEAAARLGGDASTRRSVQPSPQRD